MTDETKPTKTQTVIEIMLVLTAAGICAAPLWVFVIEPYIRLIGR